MYPNSVIAKARAMAPHAGVVLARPNALPWVLWRALHDAQLFRW